MSAPDLPERLRAVTGLLESVGADRTLLDVLSPEEREREMRAVAAVCLPDPICHNAPCASTLSSNA